MTGSDVLSGFRITVVNSYYRRSTVSGENLAVDMQIAALKSAGACVDVVARSTDAMKERKLYPVDSLLRVATGKDFGGYPVPRSEGSQHILLVDNLFPNFGIKSFLDWNGPLLAVMHNFRTFCANGLLLRDGYFCDACLTGNSLSAVLHGCYRNSRLSSVPLAISTWGGVRANPLLERANVIICQSSRAKRIFEQAGISSEKISLIPGFTYAAKAKAKAEVEVEGKINRWIFLGRLSPEKGCLDLIREWPPNVALDVIGDGEQRDLILAEKPNSVQLLGQKTHKEVLDLLSGYVGLVYPGICSEGAYPMVIREAMARGLPILASEGSSAADLIENEGGGLVYRPGETRLKEGIKEVTRNRAIYSIQARRIFDEVFAQEIWTSKMRSVLELSIENRRVN